MLIYIVEDDTDIRELESYAMKSSGYEVQSFGAVSYTHLTLPTTPYV